METIYNTIFFHKALSFNSTMVFSKRPVLLSCLNTFARLLQVGIIHLENSVLTIPDRMQKYFLDFMD